MSSWHSILSHLPLRSPLQKGLAWINDRWIVPAENPVDLELPLGTVIDDRYCITGVLGAGAFGRVYQVEHRGRNHETWVLKEFLPRPEWVQDMAKARELFDREARILLKLNHPQIPRFLESLSDTQQGRPRFFLVQEYISGRNYEFIRGTEYPQGMPEALVQQFLLDFLPILDYLHRQNPPVIHRDISPDNILRCHATGLPKLIDFGAVKQNFSQLTGAQLTGVQSHTRIGKTGYAPSEQLLGQSADPRCDLYALGVTAIVLLTGQRPDVLQTRDQWHWERFLKQPTDPYFIALLNQMIAMKRSDRFQSASAVFSALQSLKNLPQYTPLSPSLHPFPLQSPPLQSPQDDRLDLAPPIASPPPTPATLAIQSPPIAPIVSPPVDPIVPPRVQWQEENLAPTLQPQTSQSDINIRQFLTRQAFWVGGISALIVLPFVIGHFVKNFNISGASAKENHSQKTANSTTECDRFSKLYTDKSKPDVMNKINDQFWQKYPELKGQALTPEDPHTQQWCTIGTEILKDY